MRRLAFFVLLKDVLLGANAYENSDSKTKFYFMSMYGGLSFCVHGSILCIRLLYCFYVRLEQLRTMQNVRLAHISVRLAQEAN